MTDKLFASTIAAWVVLLVVFVNTAPVASTTVSFA